MTNSEEIRVHEKRGAFSVSNNYTSWVLNDAPPIDWAAWLRIYNSSPSILKQNFLKCYDESAYMDENGNWVVNDDTVSDSLPNNNYRRD